jgi:serine/threonine protein kinase
MKRLPEFVAQHFIAQVCMAVRHLHLHGVIHRDIKPDNVMVSAGSTVSNCILDM